MPFRRKRDCQYTPAITHSGDRVEVDCGRKKPVILCGYHATPAWIKTALQWVNQGGK